MVTVRVDFAEDEQVELAFLTSADQLSKIARGDHVKSGVGEQLFSTCTDGRIGSDGENLLRHGPSREFSVLA